MKKIWFILFIFISAASFAENITKVYTGSSESSDKETITVYAEIDIPDGFHLTWSEEFLKITLADPPSGITLAPVVYPEGNKKILFNEITGGNGEITEYYGKTVLSAELKVEKNLLKGPVNYLDVSVSYQMCDDTACYPPDTETNRIEVSIPGTNPVFASILLYLILAFLGGVIMNITPCVLPVLSIKAITLVKQSGMDKKKILNNSLFYTAGVIVSMLVLGAATVILKLSGEYAGFSFQNQNPQFNIILLVILVAFSLSLFNLFTIRVPGMTRAAEKSSRAGYAGSFFSGIFAILLGVSCTAPLLAPALGFAFSLPYAWIIVFFFFTGFGLAFPFLLIGIKPRLISVIPKPGKWLEIFKEIMGFGLMLFAVHRLWVLRKLVDDLVPVLLYLLLIAFALWLYGKLSQPINKKSVQITGLVLLMALAVPSTAFILDGDYSSGDVKKRDAEYSDSSVWQPFSPDLLEYYRVDGQPVFIDFTADWCLNCQTNKTFVLRTESIGQEFRERNVQLLVADFTAEDPVIEEYLESYGKAGVPVYAFYPPWTEEPVFLPELLTKKMITDMLDKYLPEPAEPLPVSKALSPSADSE